MKEKKSYFSHRGENEYLGRYLIWQINISQHIGMKKGQIFNSFLFHIYDSKKVEKKNASVIISNTHNIIFFSLINNIS